MPIVFKRTSPVTDDLAVHFMGSEAPPVLSPPVGAQVRIVTRIARIDGRIYTLEIEAFDESEKIGEAMHQRAAVTIARFAERARAKTKSSCTRSDSFVTQTLIFGTWAICGLDQDIRSYLMSASVRNLGWVRYLSIFTAKTGRVEVLESMPVRTMVPQQKMLSADFRSDPFGGVMLNSTGVWTSIGASPRKSTPVVLRFSVMPLCQSIPPAGR